MNSTQFSPLPPEHASGLADDIALSRVPKQYQGMVVEASKQYGVPIHVIGNVIKMESSGNQYAQSNAGARGLMQLMPSTFQGLGGRGDPYEPQQNIALGTKYLNQLLNQYGNNEQMALAAYNWGPGNLNKRGLQNAPAETQNYLAKYDQLMGKSTGNGLSSLLSKSNAKGPQGDLPTQLVNINQPIRDSSIGSHNQFVSQPTQSIAQRDFPRQPIVEAQNGDDNSLESILDINKIF